MDKLAEEDDDKPVMPEFLQTDTAAAIRRLVDHSVDISSADREVVTNFLSQSGEEGESMGRPTDEITGILKQMHETMGKENVQLNKDEVNAETQYQSLKAAKESQIDSLRKEISTKTERIGKLTLQLVEDRADLDATQKALDNNTKMYDRLTAESKARREQYDEEKHTRADENIAITDTIQILNDDAAFRLFKKTLPAAGAASFLQMTVSPKELRSNALNTLNALQSALPKGVKDPRLSFVALALKSKKTSFTKVLDMIDEMIVLLNKEQKDDEDKKNYCETEIAQTDDEKKTLDNDISDLKKEIEQMNLKLKGLNADIKAKSESIEALDKQVVDATKQRKEEHTDYMENLQANNAAKDILTVAKARLGRFYDGQAAKAKELLQTEQAPKEQTVGKALKIKALNTEQPSSVTAAPLSENSKAGLAELFDGGSVAFMQVDMQTQVEDTEAAITKLTADGNMVIKLITSITNDIEKEVKEMTQDEKDAQFEYEYALKESAEKRAGDAKALSELEGSKAEAEGALHRMLGSTKSKTKESNGKGDYLADLHKECDWLLEHFKTRRSARTGEIDALKKAKVVLNGNEPDADFLQVTMHTWKGLRSVKGHA